MPSYNYIKASVVTTELMGELSVAGVPCSNILYDGSTLTIDFEDALDQSQQDAVQAVVDAHTATVVVTDMLPVDPGSGGVRMDMMQHPHGWTSQRRGFLVTVPANTQHHHGYYHIKDKVGNPVQYRAITGGYVTEQAQKGDKFDIDLVVKGSDVGGVDGDNDIELYSFCYEEYPVNLVKQVFFAPDRSMLLPVTADKLNPQLPAVSIYFRVHYSAKDANNNSQVDVHCWLEGFQPPAA